MKVLIILSSVVATITISLIALSFYFKLKRVKKKYRYILGQLDVTNNAFFALGKTPPFNSKSADNTESTGNAFQ